LAKPILAQVPDTSDVDIENILEDDENEANQEQLLELLSDLLENPLDINRSNAVDFTQIPFISPILAQNIVRFRETNGNFTSIPELLKVEGMSEDLYEKCRPFLTIGEKLDIKPTKPARFASVPKFNDVMKGLSYDFIERNSRRIETGSGYEPPTEGQTSYYLGTPLRSVTRFRAKYRRNVSFNLTADKDPGESFGWKPNESTYGYDFVSAHVGVQNIGRIRSLVIGDFVTTFGQGLALSRGSGFGKGSETTRALVRKGTGITPYSSTDEVHFFRGVGTTILLTPNLSLSGFGSVRNLDASITEPNLVDEQDLETATLYDTGLHRTPNELAKKNQFQEKIGGGAIEWRKRLTSIGVVGYVNQFDKPLTQSDDAYRMFRFAGSKANMLSAYFNYGYKKTYFFGEVARDLDGTIGGVGGILLKPSSYADALVMVRNYPRDFTSLHGYAFGERNGETNNESGVYMGAHFRLSKVWALSTYFDQFSFPWLRYGVYRPTSGYEALAKLDYKPKSWFTMYVQAKTETKEEAFKVVNSNGLYLPTVAPQTRQSARFNMEYAFNRAMRFRTRLDATRFQFNTEPAEWGFLIFQDLRYKPLKNIQLDLRYAFFDTDSYDARVYAFENDALYVLSNPSFSGKGQRAYLLMRYTPFAKFDIWFKVGATHYENKYVVGSGLDEVQGSRLRDVNLQFRIRF
jgi:hypothetical protein